MEIFTSGTSGISAERFFQRLKEARVTAIIDTRLHPSSQLAGYAKQDSLMYFASEILGVRYMHEGLLCPKSENLKDYRDTKIDWNEYERQYVELLRNRDIINSIDFSEWGEKPVILCSETLPDKCHRRLAANYLLSNSEFATVVFHL